MVKQKDRHKKKRKQEIAAAYLFTLPSFIGFLVFVLFPLIWVIVISFQKYNVFTTEYTFVGMKNYLRILSDKRSLETLGNSVWYAVFCTLGNTGLGLLLAVFVDNKLSRKLSIFFRSVYFFPSLVGLVYVAIIWNAFFQTDAGVINYYLQTLGMDKIAWLNSKDFSKISVLILDVWKSSGMSMLLILAGLQNVDRNLLEAAQIDGANGIQKFLHVTIPITSPQIFFVLIMNMTGALRIYESSVVLTGGGPGDSSRSLVMLIAEKAFTSFNYGEATALSVLLLVLIGFIIAFQFIGSKKWVHYE
jgi:multiple sugar transport system permease protein